MPDSSTVKTINNTNFTPRAGAAVVGNEMNVIGTLLNNISAQNGVTGIVNKSGIKLYGKGNASLLHRFKIMKAWREIEGTIYPDIIVYNGAWIRNDKRASLVAENEDDQYVVLEFGLFSMGRNYIYVEIDDAVSPNIIEAKVTPYFTGYEPSSKEPNGNIICFIGYVDLSKKTVSSKDFYYISKIVQWVFTDIVKDNVNQIEESTGVFTDGGSTGVEFEIVTDVQWDESDKELQKKYRTVTIQNGRFLVSEESDWTEFATAVACPT